MIKQNYWARQRDMFKSFGLSTSMKEEDAWEKLT